MLALVALFPRTNVGLELAAVIMIFTGQAWNMTFSLYHSLKSVPQDLEEASVVYRFTWWQRFKWMELPYGTTGLVWNSMMSMAGGWFFLMINEAFRLGDHDFRLPGLGSYMSVAVHEGKPLAMALAVVAMMLMIVALDQLLWRPVVVWAQRFRVEETTAAETSRSWFLDLVRRSGLVRRLRHWRRSRSRHHHGAPDAPRPIRRRRRLRRPPVPPRSFPRRALGLLLAVIAWGAFRLVHLLAQLPLSPLGDADPGRRPDPRPGARVDRRRHGLGGARRPRHRTLAAAVAAAPAGGPGHGLLSGARCSSRWRSPLFHAAGLGLGTGSIVLMLLGTQWYILFNVIAGASSVPSDLREAVVAFRLTRRERFWTLYLPAIFPYLVTGWVTAAGGAWNASIVAEYVTYKGATLTTFGLGAAVSEAAERGAVRRAGGRRPGHVPDRRHLQPARVAALLSARVHALLPDEVRPSGG